MKDFKDLRVWSKAHELTIALYRITRGFPKEELFGLTSQIRRAAASIGANIAEGSARRSDGELTRFLNIAPGSAGELEYHLLLARDLELLTASRFQQLAKQVDDVQRMLTALINQVQPLNCERRIRLRRNTDFVCSQPEARSSQPTATSRNVPSRASF